MIKLNHKKLDSWEMGIDLTTLIYTVTQIFPKKIYGLTSQMRRAAISVPSNISEGAARPTVKDRRRFFQIAWASLVEMDTQVEIAVELSYLETSQIDQLDKKLNSAFALLTNLINSTKW